MGPADIPAAVALARAQGWRDRTRMFEFVLRVPTCQALVGITDGEIVATGLATAHGSVGWLGGIVVAAPRRGRGYGRRMTEELISRLEDSHCRTLSLEATDAGRPMYERMGFRLFSHYHQLEASHVPARPDPPQGARFRALRPGDLAAMMELDRAALGEDRSAPLGTLAQMNGGWILERQGAVAGYVIHAERSYGPIVAPMFEDGLALLDLHRTVVEPGETVRAGIPDEHVAAWRELLRRGWVETWQAPRLIRGPDVPWHPTRIWGQINSAMG